MHGIIIQPVYRHLSYHARQLTHLLRRELEEDRRSFPEEEKEVEGEEDGLGGDHLKYFKETYGEAGFWSYVGG